MSKYVCLRSASAVVPFFFFHCYYSEKKVGHLLGRNGRNNTCCVIEHISLLSFYWKENRIMKRKPLDISFQRYCSAKWVFSLFGFNGEEMNEEKAKATTVEEK